MCLQVCPVDAIHIVDK
ncbi:MAG: hypothetical protein CL902_13450 [Dehalococcoidia bacterium]|nr:hypothetical protein [Dehalococcoidia bacterium]